MAKRKPTKPLHPAVAIARGRRILAERAAAKAKPEPGERLRQQQALFGKAPVETTRFEPAPTLIASKSAKHPGCWTLEVTTLAAEMWTVQRASLSEIAKALSERVGRPVSRNSVIEKIRRLGLVGKGGSQSKQGGWPKPGTVAEKGNSGLPFEEKGSQIRELGSDCEIAQNRKLTRNACPNPEPVSISGAPSEVEKIDTPEPDLSALFGIQLSERPSHPAGHWPITDLRMGQCRFIAGDDHLCCGEPAPIGPGNPHGSWCEGHRAVVFSTESRLADRRFLKAAGKCR